ncbi:MAG: helix-turn-helix domain-containing protein [Candidatus Thermoplasmatota archaeon]|nr:helix-turn-helix domain-containing protein [Candidatus Thermoplasmatota archaeon]
MVKRKLKDDQIKEILRLREYKKYSIRKIARIVRVSPTTVNEIINPKKEYYINRINAINNNNTYTIKTYNEPIKESRDNSVDPNQHSSLKSDNLSNKQINSKELFRETIDEFLQIITPYLNDLDELKKQLENQIEIARNNNNQFLPTLYLIQDKLNQINQRFASKQEIEKILQENNIKSQEMNRKQEELIRKLQEDIVKIQQKQDEQSKVFDLQNELNQCRLKKLEDENQINKYKPNLKDSNEENKPQPQLNLIKPTDQIVLKELSKNIDFKTPQNENIPSNQKQEPQVTQTEKTQPELQARTITNNKSPTQPSNEITIGYRSLGIATGIYNSLPIVKKYFFNNNPYQEKNYIIIEKPPQIIIPDENKSQNTTIPEKEIKQGEKNT